MNILFCSGEAYPFSKSGGLADIAAALPKALNQLGHQVKIITPLYQDIKVHITDMTYLGKVNIKMDMNEKVASFYSVDFEETTYIFIENDELFDRVKYYGYEDDALRFTFFNLAILEYIKLTSDYPEIIHSNDWQCGMVPFLLDAKYRRLNKKFNAIKTILSIHNLEKQGSYPIETEKLFGNKNFTYIHLDRVNFLKCGIMRAHVINTVSEHYINEILTRFYGFSLDGALKSRRQDLYGILNGLDQDLYNPLSNANLYKNYNESNFTKGKRVNKIGLLKQLNLEDDHLPLVVYINRFARQKGLDLLMLVLEQYLKSNQFNFIAIGSGDALYESYFKDIQKKYQNHVYYEKGFDFELSQKAYAASDIFILPSLFEPCGLNHMIAMRYGSLPLVRETGGLKDTVIPYNKDTGLGVGFTFKNYDADELIETIDYALDVYCHHQDDWNHLVSQAMQVNHSLEKMAKQYETLYEKILSDT